MKEKKNPLGRTLNDLLSKREEIISIPVNTIRKSKFQPRIKLTPESLKELIDSIKEKGIIEPIIVRPVDDGFEIVAGHRRFLAAIEAGLEMIPCIVKELTEKEAAEISIIENIQRENLNPIEEATAIKKLIEEFNLTHEEVAKKIGKSRVYVTNLLRLLKLPEKIREKLEKKEISEGHARVLLSIRDENEMVRLTEEIVKSKISVREIEKKVFKKDSKREFQKEEEILRKKWGVDVKIHLKGKTGKIEFIFKNEDEFKFLLEELLK
ncbi:MAG: ParB/RepB/Spo0J family partition protein [Candidatus Hydrothermales bacterium]